MRLASIFSNVNLPTTYKRLLTPVLNDKNKTKKSSKFFNFKISKLAGSGPGRMLPF